MNFISDIPLQQNIVLWSLNPADQLLLKRKCKMLAFFCGCAASGLFSLPAVPVKAVGVGKHLFGKNVFCGVLFIFLVAIKPAWPIL